MRQNHRIHKNALAWVRWEEVRVGFSSGEAGSCWWAAAAAGTGCVWDELCPGSCGSWCGTGGSVSEDFLGGKRERKMKMMSGRIPGGKHPYCYTRLGEVWPRGEETMSELQSAEKTFQLYSEITLTAFQNKSDTSMISTKYKCNLQAFPLNGAK